MSSQQQELLAAIRDAQRELELQERLNADACELLSSRRSFIAHRQLLMANAEEALRTLEDHQSHAENLKQTDGADLRRQIQLTCDELSQMQFPLRSAKELSSTASIGTDMGYSSSNTCSISGFEGERSSSCSVSIDWMVLLARKHLRETDAIYFDVNDSLVVLSRAAQHDLDKISDQVSTDSETMTALNSKLQSQLTDLTLNRFVHKEQLQAEVRKQRKRIADSDFDRLKRVALSRAFSILQQKYGHLIKFERTISEKKHLKKEYARAQTLIPRIYDLLEAVFEKQVFEDEGKFNCEVQERFTAIEKRLQEMFDHYSVNVQSKPRTEKDQDHHNEDTEGLAEIQKLRFEDRYEQLLVLQDQILRMEQENLQIISELTIKAEAKLLQQRPFVEEVFELFNFIRSFAS